MLPAAHGVRDIRGGCFGESSLEVGKGMLGVSESSQVVLDRKEVWWCSIHRLHVGRVCGRLLNYAAEGMYGHKNQM